MVHYVIRVSVTVDDIEARVVACLFFVHLVGVRLCPPVLAIPFVAPLQFTISPLIHFSSIWTLYTLLISETLCSVSPLVPRPHPVRVSLAV